MLTTNQHSFDISGIHGRIKLQKHDPSNSNSKLDFNPNQTNPMIQNIIKKSSNSLLFQKSNKNSESILAISLKSKQSLNNINNPSSNYGSRTYMKNWMEIERDQVFTYEYLCHVAEAKQWVESCLNIDLGPLDDLGVKLQNGVLLAKLAKTFEPTIVKRIFEDEKLSFRHSDNIHYFLKAAFKAGLPQNFLFELTDLYSRKNIPKVIYCIHALSHLLSRKGLAPNIKNLVGYLDFSEHQLNLTQAELDKSGIALPCFVNVSSDLSRILKEEVASIRITKRSKSSHKPRVKKSYATIHYSSQVPPRRNDSVEGGKNKKSRKLIPSDLTGSEHELGLDSSSFLPLPQSSKSTTDISKSRKLTSTPKTQLGPAILSPKSKLINILSRHGSKRYELQSDSSFSQTRKDRMRSSNRAASPCLSSASINSESDTSDHLASPPCSSDNNQLSFASRPPFNNEDEFDQTIPLQKFDNYSYLETGDVTQNDVMEHNLSMVRKRQICLQAVSQFSQSPSDPELNLNSFLIEPSFIQKSEHSKDYLSSQSQIQSSTLRKPDSDSILTNSQVESFSDKSKDDLSQKSKISTKSNLIIDRTQVPLERKSSKMTQRVRNILDRRAEERREKNSISKGTNKIQLDQIPTPSAVRTETKVSNMAPDLIQPIDSPLKVKNQTDHTKNGLDEESEDDENVRISVSDRVKAIINREQQISESKNPTKNFLPLGPREKMSLEELLERDKLQEEKEKTLSQHTSQSTSQPPSQSASIQSDKSKKLNQVESDLVLSSTEAKKELNELFKVDTNIDSFDQPNPIDEFQISHRSSSLLNKVQISPRPITITPPQLSQSLRDEPVKSSHPKIDDFNESGVQTKLSYKSYKESDESYLHSPNKTELTSDQYNDEMPPPNSNPKELALISMFRQLSTESQTGFLRSMSTRSVAIQVGPPMSHSILDIPDHVIEKALPEEKALPKPPLSDDDDDDIPLGQITKSSEQIIPPKEEFIWEHYTPFIVIVQGIVRGHQQRNIFKKLKFELTYHSKVIMGLQAQIRGVLSRCIALEKLEILRETAAYIDDYTLQRFQALSRQVLARRKWVPCFYEAKARTMGFFDALIRFQALCRKVTVQRKWARSLGILNNLSGRIEQLQGMCRGYIIRQYYRESFIPQLEFATPSSPLSYPFPERHYEHIVKFQEDYWANRERMQQASTISQEPPVASMQSFLHLLEESDLDFAEELELEQHRQEAIKKIREIYLSESALNDLDIKIALLIRNRITLEEVIHSVANPNATTQQEPVSTGRVPLKSLDRENRHRLDCYQQLFYLLQTQPRYIAKLLTLMNRSAKYNPEGNSDAQKFFEMVVLTLFNFAQNPREEYLLLNLFQSAIHHELSGLNLIEEFLRGNPVFIKLAVHYNRGAKERQYLRDLLQPIINEILDEPDIDLQTNPLLIYRQLIKQEEMRTGIRSTRPYDVTPETALSDAETRTVLIQHLQQLRSITDQFIDRIYKSLDQMPYGIRYIAKELKNSLMRKFPEEHEGVIIKIVGHLVYYRYINPAIVAPETFDVTEREVTPYHRRCLAEVAKMLNQVSMGKLFTDDNLFLQPLNNYVAYTSEKFAKYIQAVTEVPDPEHFFNIDEFLDLANTSKPVIYISPQEIYSLHRLISDNKDFLVTKTDDPLLIILKDLGEVPIISADQAISNSKPISLFLTNRFSNTQETEAKMKHLFVETKRLVSYVIQVQSGSSLLDILEKPIGSVEEQRFRQLAEKEAQIHAKHSSHPLLDLSAMTFVQLKQLAFSNCLKLEQGNWISRNDNYQKIISSIAVDIRTKHRRRTQRKDEITKIRQTLKHLHDKMAYMESCRQTYCDYLNSCRSQLNAKAGKHKQLVIPFTKNYFNLKQLSNMGHSAKFGSFLYTAERLHNKGVLVSMNEFTPKQYPHIDVIISCKEIGKFNLTAHYLKIPLPGAATELQLEELLQYQFDNVRIMALFDGEVKLNVNLLLRLINKKFYR